MPLNSTPRTMIPNTVPGLRAVFAPASGQQYTLPVVAWTDGREALAPSVAGHLFNVKKERDFVRLERDMQFVDEAQETLEEGLREVLTARNPIEAPEDRRPVPTPSE